MGRHVREARERRGMARKVLSQNAGVSERYLAQLEAGEGNASVLLLRSVARALGVSVTELLDPHESSVEQRLIRRFLDRLPEHRLEDVVFRLMRDFGHEEASRASASRSSACAAPARRRWARRSRRSSRCRSSSSTARSSVRPASACPRCSCSTGRRATGGSSGAASSG